MISKYFVVLLVSLSIATAIPCQSLMMVNIKNMTEEINQKVVDAYNIVIQNDSTPSTLKFKLQHSIINRMKDHNYIDDYQLELSALDTLDSVYSVYLRKTFSIGEYVSVVTSSYIYYQNKLLVSQFERKKLKYHNQIPVKDTGQIHDIIKKLELTRSFQYGTFDRDEEILSIKPDSVEAYFFIIKNANQTALLSQLPY